jgi:Gram-negative bacterial TonB protein C-terminal
VNALGNVETTPGWSDTSTGTFIYVDRAFRFFGPGTHPFWDSLGQPLGPSCADSPAVAGKRFPLLISPAFEAAIKKHLSGVVEMNITVSPKGTTDGIEILSGDPRLAPHARSVAMVFFNFPPFRKCGQPVQGAAKETVNFPKP